MGRGGQVWGGGGVWGAVRWGGEGERGEESVNRADAGWIQHKHVGD